MTTSNRKFHLRLNSLINEIESNDNKEELIQLMREQVADDTYTVPD